jgi:hypothetical protein
MRPWLKLLLMRDEKDDGIDHIEVQYGSETLTVSAKEIWEALKPERQP